MIDYNSFIKYSKYVFYDILWYLECSDWPAITKYFWIFMTAYNLLIIHNYTILDYKAL